MLIVDDRNYRDMIRREEDRGFLHGQNLEPAEYAAGNIPNLPAFAESFRLIPRTEWADRIRAREERAMARMIRQAGIPTFNQGNTNWCWAHAAVKSVCACLAVQGTPKILAPESVAGPASGWRNVGGTLTQAFTQLRSTGACSRDFVTQANTVRSSVLKPGWQADAIRVGETYSLIGRNIYDQCITAMFEGFALAVGVYWWMHAICYLDPVLLDNGSVGVLFDNSHGTRYGDDGMAVFTESRGTPETGWGVIACRSVLYVPE